MAQLLRALGIPAHEACGNFVARQGEFGGAGGRRGALFRSGSADRGENRIPMQTDRGARRFFEPMLVTRF